MRLTGTLEQVETYVARTFASADAATAATVVFVDRVEPLFSETGTITVDINGDEYTATPVSDDVAPYITVSPALVADIDALDPVTVVPATEVKKAWVSFPSNDDQGEMMDYVVPHNLKAYTALSDGPKTGDERVAVIVESEPFGYVVDVVNRPTLLDGGTIDPDSTIPPPALTDGEPPSGSPTPTLEQFSVGGLRWSVTPVANVDPVRFKVYADTVDPPTQDAAHLVADSASHSGTFSAINGVRLLPDDSTLAPDPIYVAVVEYDADGDAAMGASSAAVVPKRADNDDISALYAYLGSIEANQIAAGSVLTQLLNVGDYIEIDGANSTITIFGDTAHTQPLVQLRPDGSVFRGQVIADDVSVLNGLVLQGLLSHIAQNAGVTIDSSVADPGTAPILTVSASPSLWPALPTGYASRGFCWDGSQWLRLIRKADTTTKVELINTSGVVTSTVTLGSTSTTTNANSIVKVGSNWFVMLAFTDPSDYDHWRIAKYDTSGNRLSVAADTQQINSGVPFRPAVGTDGTDLLVAAADTAFTADPSILKYDTSLTYLSSLTTSGVADFNNLTFIGRQNFDFGADRIVIGGASDSGSPKPIRGFVFSVSGTVVTEVATQSFDLVDDPFSGGFAWDGTNFFSAGSAGKLNKYNGYYPAASENAYVAHRDNNGADHTKVSPIASVNLKKRQYVQAALTPAPSGAATPSVWMKLATSTPAATALLARSETITTRNVLLDPSVAGGSALTTDTNTFGTGTPGFIQTQLGGYKLNGDGTESSPKLGHSDEKTLSSAASPTSTTNIDMNDLDMSVTVQATTDVVWVRVDVECVITTTATINVVELLIDGTPHPKLCRNQLSSGATGRVSGGKEWRITGLSAGAHTIEFRTRNTAGSTAATISATHSSARYWTTV